MTKTFLNPLQRRTVEIIESLGFGTIERLRVRCRSLCCELEPGIVQDIKSDSEPQRKPDDGHADLTLKTEFECLFDRLIRLVDTTIHIEVWHNPPFRPVRARRFD